MKQWFDCRKWAAWLTVSLALASGAASVQAAAIMNGPYLLAPTATGMTVSFETRDPVLAKVKYGAAGKLDSEVDVTCQRGKPWKDNPQGDCLYRAALKGLTPATLYNYTVALPSGEAQSGTFRTLKGDSNDLHFFTISDSHGFKGSKVLTEAVLRDRPDFILHTGDIPNGMGHQKEKYQESWFAPGADFLRHIPVVYIYGNHDVGPHFPEYFMVAQRNTYGASANGLNYSADLGPAHIIMMNSNVWGLDEMNADLSGLPVAKKTLVDIKESLEWLQKDLASAPAKQAKWRIVGMHHPYSDPFTNKRVVSVLEGNDVDVMLGGHLHGYIKGISIDPARAARTLYVTQGSTEGVYGEMNYGKPDERIFPDYPEVLALGKTIYGVVKIAGDQLSYTLYGLPKDEKAVKALDQTVLSRSDPKVSLDKVRLTPVKGVAGAVVFEGVVKNEGAGLAGVVVALNDNGRDVPINLFGAPGKERVVGLNPGETRTVSKTITIDAPGKHVLRVGKVSQTLTVAEPTAKFVVNGLDVNVGEGEYSNMLFASVDVINPHKAKSEGRVDLFVNDKVVDSRLVSLRANEKLNLKFSHAFQEGGEYKVKVGDLAAKTIQIEDTLKGTPLVQDMSGKGNNAILRGSPKITKMADGAVSVDIAGSLGDYIEIPDSASLRVTDGLSGIVWANLNRLPIAGEMDRNPIMSKGPSLGWGANYLLRMLVKKSGGAYTAGICYDTTEYFWEGKTEGKAPLAQWAQYSMSFGKKSGGFSYIDAKKAAQIPPLGDVEIEYRNWEGHPIFIGYARLGQLIKELKRPPRFAHFVGQVSQVRFYTTDLSAEEIKSINDNPTKPGPKAEKMAVWLNFENIEKEGVHRTQWMKPAFYEPKFKSDRQQWKFDALNAQAKVPAGASLIATVEVSDTAESVKGSKEVRLADGNQTIDLSGLPQGQYLRIVTRFVSAVGAEGVAVPELKQYKVAATLDGRTSTQLTWGTRADWEKGSIEGAIGFEPLDRLTVIGAGPSVRN